MMNILWEIIGFLAALGVTGRFAYLVPLAKG